MMGDRRLRHVEAIDNLAGADRFVLGCNQAEDFEPGFIAQCLEDGDQAITIVGSNWRRFDNRFATEIDWSQSENLCVHMSIVGQHIDDCQYVPQHWPSTIVSRLTHATWGDLMRKQDVLMLFDYMYWANHQLLDHTATLTPEQFIATDAVTTRDLRATLVHELDVEWSWRLNIQQKLDDSDKELVASDFPDLASLRERWTEDESEMRAWLESLGDADMDAEVDSSLTMDRRPRWQYLMHIFTHAQQQQADAATMLSQFGASPGELGFIRWMKERQIPV